MLFIFVCFFCLNFVYVCFFFFQAEDGIRDGRVTGVQTCALPISHNADVRRVNSRHFPGWGNIPELGVFAWRLKSYTVTLTPALCYEEQSPNCFLFSVLGNDTPLYVNPAATPAPAPADLTLPVPIRRRRFELRRHGGKSVSGVPF